MTVVLFNTWAITFLALGFLYSIEGKKDKEHWEWNILLGSTLCSLTPVLAQYLLLNSLWKYGKYTYHHVLKRRP